MREKCRTNKSFAIAHGLEAVAGGQSSVVGGQSSVVGRRSSVGGRQAVGERGEGGEASAAGTAGASGRRGRPRAGVDEGVLEAVRKAIAAVPGGASKADVIAATGLTDGQWNAAIRELLTRGQVTRTGTRRGARYHVPGRS